MFPSLATGVGIQLRFALASLALASSSWASWNLTSVEDVRSFGLSSTRFDAADRPAIAYGGNSLYYATWDGSAWVVQTVERGCAAERGPSLAFDPAGNPAISYHDESSALKLARWNGSVWSADTVDALVTVAGATSLAFDPSGNPAIAYYDESNYSLRYASLVGASWTIATVDGGTARVGEFPSLAFDPAGRPAISYYDQDNYDLKLARFDGTAWQLELVDGTFDVGQWSSLAFDRAGNPAISYCDRSGSPAVRYSFWNGVSWTREEVAFGYSTGTSLGFDGAGNAVVAYGTQSGDGYLEYATRGPSGWTSVTVDPARRTGQYPSLAFDSTGKPGISYLDLDNSTIKLAAGTGTVFTTQHVDGYGPIGFETSVAFDGTGNLSMSYSDGALGGLRYARFDGSSWTSESVAPGFWIGAESSLRFDSASNPLIAFDDRTGGNLELARWNGSSWMVETVASGPLDPTAPMFPSLAIDPAGNPAISYYWWGPTPGFRLNFARWNGSSWALETVDSNVALLNYASRTLGFDRSGNPAIVYIGASRELMYASWNGATWDIQAVDPLGFGFASLGFGGSGEPVIGYYGSGGVRIARRTGTVWQVELVTPGYGASMAIDPAGEPVISFQDFATEESRLARWNGTTWSIETIVSSYSSGTLAISPSGDIAAVYESGQFCRAPEVAISASIDAVGVHRGVVASLSPGWQAAALPLTSLNDDQTPPFPIAAALPGSASDGTVPAVPLVIYRVLRPNDLQAGNSLRVVKGATGIDLSF